MINWVTRSETMPDGHVRRYRECAVPGEPGVTRRVYLNPVSSIRYGGPIGIARDAEELEALREDCRARSKPKAWRL